MAVTLVCIFVVFDSLAYSIARNSCRMPPTRSEPLSWTFIVPGGGFYDLWKKSTKAK